MSGRWRLGRNNKQLIYRQDGPDASKQDRLTLVAFSETDATLIVELLNRSEAEEQRQVCTADYHVDPHRSCIMR